ncbi:hypothetical protein NG99_10460 [Erwinia typographi]|uniref:Uncharacterized protein n=1 Tax=Erwinia typographi TaxID=371042 RepID=A0A0A3Z8Z3_9GAMM|nr:hypothetical protein [Erwinia typographi]KGT94254.1 hypothetical protein NG99_10460 [Erwinia typographi]
MSAYDNSVNPDFFRNMLYLKDNSLSVDQCVNQTAGTTVNRLVTQLAALQDQVNTHVSELIHRVFLSVLEASDESGQ